MSPKDFCKNVNCKLTNIRNFGSKSQTNVAIAENTLMNLSVESP